MAKKEKINLFINRKGTYKCKYCGEEFRLKGTLMAHNCLYKEKKRRVK